MSQVGLVISSSATAKGLQYATERNVPVVVAPKKDQTSKAYCEQIFRPIRQAEIDLVVMGGFSQACVDSR